MKRIKVSLSSVDPGLLQNRFSVEDEMAANRNYKKKMNLPTIEIELERAAYRKDSGELYMPGEWLYQSLLKASGEFTVPGRGKKSFRDYIKSGIVIEPEQIGFGTKSYSTDARPTVIRATKGRIMRYRPHLPKWSATFDIVILDEDLIDVETLHTILVRAGQTVGVGDYRPRYGRFLISKFEEEKASAKKEKVLATA